MATRDSLERSSSEIPGSQNATTSNIPEPEVPTALEDQEASAAPVAPAASATPAIPTEISAAYDKVLKSDIGINTFLIRLKQSIASARDFANFLKKRSSLEEDHAQGLKKLCRISLESTRRPDSRQGSFAHNYEEITRIHDRIAENGIQFALSLHQMHEDLQELGAEKERGRKQWKQTGLTAEKRVQDAEAAMEKAKAKYSSLAEDYDRAKTGDKQGGRFGLKGPKSAAQVEEDLHRKVQAADSDYLSKVQTAQNMRRELVSTSRPQAIQALEQLISECDSGLTLQMQKFASFNEKLLLSNGLCISPLKGQAISAASPGRSLRDVVHHIDNAADLRNFVVGFASKVAPKFNEIQYERHHTLLPQQAPQQFQPLPPSQPSQQPAPVPVSQPLQAMQPPPPNPLQQQISSLSHLSQRQIDSSSGLELQPYQNPLVPDMHNGGAAPGNYNQSPAAPFNHHIAGGFPSQGSNQSTIQPISQPSAQGGIPGQNSSLQSSPTPYPQSNRFPASSPASAPIPLRSQSPGGPNGPQNFEMPARSVFGISLEDLFARDGTAVPMVVSQCIQAVDLFGLEVEGIYRLSGTTSHISKLRLAFDHDVSYVEFRNPESFFHDVNSVAGLLKQFFRELPDPLLTREHYQGFVEAARIDDDVTRRDSLHATINSLPDPNYATLRALTLHLHRVQEHSAINRMNAGNLAICFGPTLMGSNTGPNIADAGWQVRVIDTILQNTYQIFDED